jgi:pimeloyl-ACP methyl ester carboxylesterase
VFAIPDVQYAEGRDGLIAYQIVGEGPVDLVHIAGWAQTVEGIWDLPMAERFYRRLASFARVVLVDRRGTGLSDRSFNNASAETWARDFATVVDDEPKFPSELMRPQFADRLPRMTADDLAESPALAQHLPGIRFHLRLLDAERVLHFRR